MLIKMKAIIHHRLIASGIMLLVSLMSCSKDGNTGNGSSGPSEPVTVDETKLRLYPAPEGADLSDRFTVTANGAHVDVYQVKVAPEKDEDRWAAMDDPQNSHLYYSTAAFAYFDMNDAVQVAVTVPNSVLSAKILPESAGIEPEIKGKTISFTIASPSKLTLEINGQWTQCLHLFANPFEDEDEIPDGNDPNVLYFGPGIHEVSSEELNTDGKTLYIAGGAVVKAVIDPSESYTVSDNGLKKYSPTFRLSGNGIKVTGRGILDGSELTTHSRELLYITGEDINVSGIIIVDPPIWTMPVMGTRNVNIEDIKIIGRRANSDGIDICNSEYVSVKDCFVRTLDDLVVIKTMGSGNPSGHITVEGCILWNEVAHALSIGAEVTADVYDVEFRDCDIIHDNGRSWSLRIYNTDKGTVSDIVFDNIRVEDTRQLISLWIGESQWSSTAERGHISNVTFSNINAAGNPATIALEGYGQDNRIENVSFSNVSVNGSYIDRQDIRKNSFTSGITVFP